jgi:phage gp29-like protein
MILWQTLTSNTGASGGGSLALGEVHMGVLEARKQNIAKWVANVISYQLFPAICRVNYGDDDECPVLAADHTKPEDATAKANRLKVCKDIVPLPKAWTYEQLGIPMPEKGMETIAVTAPPSPFGLPSPGRDEPPARPLRATDTAPSNPVGRGGPTAPLSRDLLAAALAEDLAPVRTRLETILALEDDAAMKAELAALQKDLPSLLPLTASRAAEALSRIIGTALLESLTEGRASARPQPAKETTA